MTSGGNGHNHASDEPITGYHPTLKVHGRQVTQSRSIAAYATTPDLTVRYSGQMVQMHYPYPSVVRNIQMLLEKALGFVLEGGDEDEENGRLVGFNHVMLNKYDNGDVYIGQHSDAKENKVGYLIHGSNDWAHFGTGNCKP